MNRDELIEYLKSLPKDITILSNSNELIDENGRLDIIIFNEYKDVEFLKCFLSP